MLKTTCRAWCCRGAGYFSGVRTYVPDTVSQRCRLLSDVRTYLPGTVMQGCRLFTTTWALWGRGAGCLRVWEPASQAPWRSLVGCLSGVGTNLQGTVGPGVQAVKSASEPTSGAKLGRGTGCLSSDSSYLLNRFEGRNWMVFYFYFMTDQEKPWHMHLLLFKSACLNVNK